MNNKTKYFIKNPEILESTLEGMDEEANKLLAENKRLRDALEKMLDLALSAGNMNWGERLQDIEEISKQALKESE